MAVARRLAGLLPLLELRLQLLLRLEPIILQSIQIALQFMWQLHLLVLLRQERLLQELQVLVLQL